MVQPDLNSDTQKVISVCDLCDSNQAIPYLRPWSDSGAFGVVRCANCGLLATYPRPASEKLAEFYPRNYYSHHPTSHPTFKEAILKHLAYHRLHYPSSHLSKTQSFSRSLALTLGATVASRHSRRLPRWISNGKLLDVGCGWGEYLRLMSDLGWDVTGVEIDAETANYAQKTLALDVKLGTLESQCFPDETFDVVTFWDVLEHLESPSATLAEAFRILKPEGWLLCKVPNSGGLQARLFRSTWRGYDLPRHLWHFGPETLRAILEKQSFSVISLESVSGLATSIGSLAYSWNARFGVPHWNQPRILRLVSFALAIPLVLCSDSVGRGDFVLAQVQKAH